MNLDPQLPLWYTVYREMLEHGLRLQIAYLNRSLDLENWCINFDRGLYLYVIVCDRWREDRRCEVCSPLQGGDEDIHGGAHPPLQALHSGTQTRLSGSGSESTIYWQLIDPIRIRQLNNGIKPCQNPDLYWFSRRTGGIMLHLVR